MNSASAPKKSFNINELIRPLSFRQTTSKIFVNLLKIRYFPKCFVVLEKL